ncbi:hypothetical protein JRQ81_006485 [Phrynocephalus forsythii]|uniref:Uncharacterized protein n=1 Tax=Phrynocephalus forsythii TaxID=171643 RepID=A0A9Q0XGU6_9SAUR|nr:hypothetical protein JRQ81_006485 [Phrynocephalus forsythii]
MSTDLCLSRNRIGNEALEKLGPLLPSLHHLKVLRLSSCNINFYGVAHLSRVFLKCQKIEQIRLKFCDISDSASKSLAQGIRRCSLLEEIKPMSVDTLTRQLLLSKWI